MEKAKALIGLLIVTAIGLLMIFVRLPNNPVVSQKKVLLNTYVTITAFGPEKKTKVAVEKAFTKMAEVESKLNRYSGKSEVTKINEAKGRAVKVSSLTYEALKTAIKYNKMSSGYFDVTVGNVTKLWDFNQRRIPPSKELQKARTTIKPKSLLLLGNNNVKTKSGMTLDLGALIKGLAVDKAEAVLKEEGIKSALITTGSSTTLMGKKEMSRKWTIGIRHPRKENELLGLIAGNDVTISTSGDYQQYFVLKGKRYNHIINPQTGYPQDDFMSVTVVSPKKAMDTDIISTAIFAMGKEKGLRYAKQIGIDYVTVTKNGAIIKSAGIEKYMQGNLSY